MRGLFSGGCQGLMMSQGERYGIVVYIVAAQANAPPFKPWAWEICRDGEPLPARIREGGFNTEHTARLAAKVALRDFLSGLAREQASRDW
jgi:hypothetical protein